MNTYFAYREPARTGKVLDRQRLGKQRIEAAQIARINLGLAPGAGWRTHPIVRAWQPYLGYLVHHYLPAMLSEWEGRGYQNEGMRAKQAELAQRVPPSSVAPAWLNDALIQSHRSYLLRRDPAHYRRFWPDLPDDLPLIWP